MWQIHSMNMRLKERLIILQSWWVASELVRRNPGLGIIESHPAGGLYDCLSIGHWDSAMKTVIDLNREGSLHVHPHHLSVMTWEGEAEAVDRREVVRRLEGLAGLHPSGATPRTTRKVLAYRIAYQMLLVGLNDKDCWDVRNARIDTSGFSGSTGDLEGFETAKVAATDRRPDDPLGDPLYRFWKVHHGSLEVSVVDIDAMAHLPRGASLDLYEKFIDCGRSVETVAAWLRSQVNK